ncbi:3'-5' exonuclease [Thermobifida alba]|uniref:3'-5' exonuclease n=1 Tax=Thermobifida alba TaxID=53522 RepID=A0ABY4L6C4_THEAE|nr:3'-5' exonuclease [Thermobifida alba]UPT23201.1 3'-5' exonuclease [Thermobifida alba]
MVFHYGRLTRDGGADPRELTFAVLALQTTGLDVDWGARLCEVAVVRMRGDGTVLDEYATLVNPGIPVGNTELHGITDAWMVGVPGFEQIAGDLVSYLGDAVVVGHDLFAAERFLAAEFDLLGIPLTNLPGLCTLTAFRTHLKHPDHRFDSLCRTLTGQWPVAEHHALEDARCLAAMLATLLTTAPQPLGWEGPVSAALPMLACGGDVAPRAAIPRRAAEDDLDALAARLPLMNNAPHPRPDGLANYRMALEQFTADGTVPAEHAERLAMLAARAGLTQHTAREVHREALARLPQRVGATSGGTAGTVAVGVGGHGGTAAPDWRQVWRPRELTPEEYRVQFAEPGDTTPEDLVIDPPEAGSRKELEKPRWEMKTVLFVTVLLVLAVAWQYVVWVV